jgi:DNA-binding CsgD family transcriptional regulator
MIGFALYWAWVDGALFTPVLYQPESSSTTLPLIHLYVLVISIVVSALLVFVKKFTVNLDSTKILVLLSGLSTVGSLCLILDGYTQNLIVLTLALAALGVGMAMQGFVWGVFATSLDGREANMCIPGVVGFSGAFGFALVGMTEAMGVIFIVALPLVSLAFLLLFKRDKKLAATETGKGGTKPTEALSKAAPFKLAFFKNIPLRFFLILLIFCAAFGAMQYLLVIPSVQSSEISRFNIGMRGIVAAIFFVGLGIFSWKPTVTYKIGFLLMLAGFLVVPFIKNEAISSAIIMMGYTCFDMMAWIVVCALGNLWKGESQQIVAFSRAVSLAGVLLGGVAGIILTQVIALERIDQAIVTTAIAYLLVTATILSFEQGPSGFWPLIGRNRGHEEEAPHSLLPEVVREISESFGLTPREQEFFGYLAQGRSIPWTVEHLSISDGTGRSHARHIYTKLSVHSRQELLDLVDVKTAEFVESDSASEGMSESKKTRITL